MGCQNSAQAAYVRDSVSDETEITIIDPGAQKPAAVQQYENSTSAPSSQHDAAGFSAKPMLPAHALPTLRQLDREQAAKPKTRQRGVKQSTIYKQRISAFPRGELQQSRPATAEIERGCLAFLSASQLEVEEQAMYAWRIISSNYEQEDQSVSLKTCQEALCAVYACDSLISEWIQLQKQYFCVSKTQFTRIFVALGALRTGKALLDSIFAGYSLENDLWNLFEFVNCQSLIRPCQDLRSYTVEDLKQYIRTNYREYPWLLQLFGLSQIEESDAPSSQNLSFMLLRVQIIDDVVFLSTLLLNLASSFAEPAEQYRQCLMRIFNTSKEFVCYLVPDFPSSAEQSFAITQSLYFSYIQLDQLQYAFDTQTQAELLRLLDAQNGLGLQSGQSDEQAVLYYDVTATIIQTKYPNLYGYLGLSKFGARRRTLQNVVAQSRTAQIVPLAPGSLREFAKLTEPDALYFFVCTLCQATELPISQAVGVLEAVFGVSEQVRLLASLVCQGTDLVLECEDFGHCFAIAQDFAGGRPFARQWDVLLRCGLRVDVALPEASKISAAGEDTSSAEDAEALRSAFADAAVQQEMAPLADIIRGAGAPAQSQAPQHATIFQNIYSQDQLDDCIEPFLLLLEAARLSPDQLCALFARLFACQDVVLERLHATADSSRDVISVLFVVAFYYSVKVNPLLHAISGDQFDWYIANSLLAALGVSVEFQCADMREYMGELARHCEPWVAALFCE